MCEASCWKDGVSLDPRPRPPHPGVRGQPPPRAHTATTLPPQGFPRPCVREDPRALRRPHGCAPPGGGPALCAPRGRLPRTREGRCPVPRPGGRSFVPLSSSKSRVSGEICSVSRANRRWGGGWKCSRIKRLLRFSAVKREPSVYSLYLNERPDCCYWL